MSRLTAQALDSKLRQLVADNPALAVAEARQALSSAADDFERLAIAGVLVDVGVVTKDAAATKAGLAVISRLHKANVSNGGITYMLGTAYSALAHVDQTPRPEWWEVTRTIRVRARRYLWEAATTEGDPRERAKAWINLGNDLAESGRWIEAYGAYIDGLRVDPGNPVAAGWAAVMLQRHLSGRAVAAPNWEPIAHHWARVAQTDLARVARTADGAEDYFRDLPSDRADEVSLPERTSLTGYEGFICRNRLYLSMALDGATHPDCWDSLAIPGLVEPISAPNEPPALIAMINTCKADYLLARRLAWDARQATTEDARHYTNTLDYAVYGEKAALTVLSIRSALDILDRVAVAASHYFGLGLRPGDIHFGSVWREQVKGQPLRSQVVAEIEAKNWALLALVGLADDLRGFGWLQGRQHLRNLATHRFVIAHDETIGSWRDTPEIEHFMVEELEAAVINSLQLARCGILYFVEAVARYESRNRDAGPHASLHLPNLGA